MTDCIIDLSGTVFEENFPDTGLDPLKWDTDATFHQNFVDNEIQIYQIMESDPGGWDTSVGKQHKAIATLPTNFRLSFKIRNTEADSGLTSYTGVVITKPDNSQFTGASIRNQDGTANYYLDIPNASSVSAPPGKVFDIVIERIGDTTRVYRDETLVVNRTDAVTDNRVAIKGWRTWNHADFIGISQLKIINLDVECNTPTLDLTSSVSIDVVATRTIAEHKYKSSFRVKGVSQSSVENHLVNICIPYDSEKMKSDMGDIRFVSDDNILRYYQHGVVLTEGTFTVETGTGAYEEDGLWYVDIDVYSGNVLAFSESDISIFEVYDDFNRTELGSDWEWIRENSSKWDIGVTESGKLTLKTITNTGLYNETAPVLKRKTTTSNDFILGVHLKMTPTANNHEGVIGVYLNDDNYINIRLIWISRLKADCYYKNAGSTPSTINVDVTGSEIDLAVMRKGTTFYLMFNNGRGWYTLYEYTGVTLEGYPFLSANTNSQALTEIPATYDNFYYQSLLSNEPIIEPINKFKPVTPENVEDWPYMAIMQVTGSPDGVLTDYPVEVTVNYAFGVMKNNFNDIRFTNMDRTEFYPFVKVSKTDGVSCKFLVKLPEIPASPEYLEILILAGKLDALSLDYEEDVYEFYDGLNDMNCDSWTPSYASNWIREIPYTAMNYEGCLQLPQYVNTTDTLYGNEIDLSSYIIELDLAHDGASRMGVLFGRKSDGYGYKFAFDINNHYFLALSKDDGTSATTFADTSSGPFNLSTNTWYTFKVDVMPGGVMKCYINDTLVFTGTDDDGIFSGMLGLYKWYTNSVFARKMRIRKTTTNKPTVVIDSWGIREEYLTLWESMQELNLYGSPSRALTNYHVVLEVPYVEGKMKSDYSDVIFLNSDRTRLLPHYLYKINSESASFVIKVDSIPIHPNHTSIFVLIGNEDAVNRSSLIECGMDFNPFDTFDGWNKSGSPSISNGIVTIHNNDNINKIITSDKPLIIEARYRKPSSFRNRMFISDVSGNRIPSFDYGEFEGRLYWNGWSSVNIASNKWYRILWIVTATGMTWKWIDEDAETVIYERTQSATISSLKLTFTASESASSIFDLDWVKIKTGTDYQFANAQPYFSEFEETWMSNSKIEDYPTIYDIPFRTDFRLRYCVKPIYQLFRTIFSARGYGDKLIRLIYGVNSIYTHDVGDIFRLTYTVNQATTGLDVRTIFIIGGVVQKRLQCRGWISWTPMGIPDIDEPISEDEEIQDDSDYIMILIGDEIFG